MLADQSEPIQEPEIVVAFDSEIDSKSAHVSTGILSADEKQLAQQPTAGIMPVKGTPNDQEAATTRANSAQYENTYQLTPLKKFQSAAVKKVIEDILAERLSKAKYDPATTPDVAKSLTGEVLLAIKELNYDRYKFIVDVSIGEFKGQGVKLGSRCLWDVSTDSYASTSYRNASLFAVCMVFGVYVE